MSLICTCTILYFLNNEQWKIIVSQPNTFVSQRLNNDYYSLLFIIE